MIPCKKCDDRGGINGYDIRVEYGWYSDKPELLKESDGYGYCCYCSRCNEYNDPSPTIKGAWKNWETKNTKNHNTATE